MTLAIDNPVLRHVIGAMERGDWATLEAHPGMYETRQHFPFVFEAFSDLHHTIEIEFAHGEMLGIVATMHAVHSGTFLGIPPTGKQVHVMVISIDRIVDGKIVQHWALPDWMSLFQQIGAFPTA
jgi:predicted ester cyclase